jgi:putative tricarboxylic transport membrane protein
MALKFGPPEYFSMMVVGILLLTYLSSGSMIKALIVAGFGLILSGVGMDTIGGEFRFTYGIRRLLDGIGIVPTVMGLFGISEVLMNLETEIRRDILTSRVKNLLPTLKDWADSVWSIIRGTVLGFFLGIIPGGGAVIASFASYAIEKKVSKHPEEFGQGAIQGVAGPEAANNANSLFLRRTVSRSASSRVAMAIFGLLNTPLTKSAGSRWMAELRSFRCRPPMPAQTGPSWDRTEMSGFLKPTLDR